jgi:hypothetical protein
MVGRQVGMNSASGVVIVVEKLISRDCLRPTRSRHRAALRREDRSGRYRTDARIGYNPRMRVKDLMNRLADRPFHGFRIHLSDGTAIPVSEPGMIIVGPSSAVIPTEFGREDGERVATRWRTVALSHMVQFADIDEPVMGKNPKKRKK